MDFRMTVRVGSLSFSLDATKARNILPSTASPEVRKSRKSPSTRARNRLRLERFLAKKKASTVPATSSSEPDCGKGRTSSEINQTTTSQASEGQRLVLNESRSKRISEIQQAAEANALKCVKPCEMTWRTSTAHWRRWRPRLQLFTRRKNAKRKNASG